VKSTHHAPELYPVNVSKTGEALSSPQLETRVLKHSNCTKMNGVTNGVGLMSLESIPPLQLAFALPSSPDTKVYLQITNFAKSLLLYVTTATVGAPAAAVSLGNLVYAMPNARTCIDLRIQLTNKVYR